MSQVNWETLEDLYEEIRRDVSFAHLRKGKNRLVPGEGDNPQVMLIGEAPGAQEAMKLRPFVGPSGVMLRRLMDLAGLWSTPKWSHGHPDFPETTGETSPNCWLTNVVKYRPPKNRTPLWTEIQDARPYLRREWEAIGCPSVIVAIGSAAFTAVVGRKRGILQRAGNPFSYSRGNKNPNTIVVWPMIHPGYGLRNEHIRPKMEEHWSTLGNWLWYGYEGVSR
jgi:uracil-DNA glycosylase